MVIETCDTHKLPIGELDLLNPCQWLTVCLSAEIWSRVIDGSASRIGLGLYCGNPCQSQIWSMVTENKILTDLIYGFEQACIAEIHVNVKEGLVIEHIILTDPDLAHGFDYSSQT